MKVNDFMNNNLEGIKNLIKSMSEKGFNFHEFIRAFAKKYEKQYVAFLYLCKKKSHRTVHAQIARNLALNMEYLGITKKGKVKSMTVFGLNNPNELWEKVK